MTHLKAIAGAVLMITIVLLFQWVQSAKGEFEFQTTYRIILHKDSSATWVVELSTPLSSEDLGDFEEFKNNADSDAMLSSFTSTINSVVGAASSLTRRLMKAENFTLKIYTSGIVRQRGVIEYCFTWVNFGLKTPSTIEIGDIFEGGFYLFPNETLEINYSELLDDYFLKLTSPRPSSQDVSRVVWMGKMDFSDGEPHLLFQSRIISVESFSLSSTQVEEGSSISVYGSISTPPPSLTIQIVYRNPENLETVREVTVGSDGAFSDNFNVAAVGDWSVSLRLPPGSQYRFNQPPQPFQFSVYEKSGSETPPSMPGFLVLLLALIAIALLLLALLLTYRSRREKLLRPPPDMHMLSDEDLVIRILKDAGGRLTQTQIKEATGFSKSKTSMVLSELQKRGLIRKIKRGREYIVELM